MQPRVKVHFFYQKDCSLQYTFSTELQSGDVWDLGRGLYMHMCKSLCSHVNTVCGEVFHISMFRLQTLGFTVSIRINTTN